MKATANAPVAIASSSTNTANNRSINPHYPVPSASIQHNWLGSNMAGLPPNRSNNPDPTTTRSQKNKSNSTHAIINTDNNTNQSNNSGLLQPRHHRNSDEHAPHNTHYPQNAQNPPNIQYTQNAQNIQYPSNIQYHTQNRQNVQYVQNAQTTHNVQSVANSQQKQKPQNVHNRQIVQFTQNAQNTHNVQNTSNPQVQNSPNAQNPQRKQNPKRQQNSQRQQNPQNQQNLGNAEDSQESTNRILVAGYPTYTQPHDILEVFTKFGNVRIDKCNSWTATLTYASPEQARSALESNKRLHIYGHFLSVKPYSAKLKAEEAQRSPKREFTMSKQKCLIIEPSKINLSGTFHQQLDLIMANIRLNQDDINRISTLYRDLEILFQTQWPGCKAIPFGSITTGLGIKTSDADCFINLPVQFRQPQVNHVSQARRLLTLQPQIFTEILAIPRANTPIVKFYHVPTDINCDLTFKTPLGAQNSRLITFLLQADPRITPVAVIIKYWAKVHELSGTGKLTNYALTLLIIFYLQQPPISILPSVEWLQRDRANDFYVDYWNTGFMSHTNFLPPTSNTSTISELLGGFFEFYSMFNFEEMVVCPFLGTPIRREVFKDTATLPSEFELYKGNVLEGLVMPIRYQTSFCIQDPFEQCHNVASAITSKLALDIKTFFKFVANAYEKEKLNNCTGLLKTMLLEKPKLIRGKTHLEYRVALFPRIVNTIISFDWKSVVRELVMTIFEKMMKIKLGKVEEKVNPDTRKEKEKYMGSVTKPIWRRKKYNSINFTPNLGIEEKQTLITEQIIKKDVQSVNLQVQVIMTFCHNPKSSVIAIRMGGGDIDAFRDFGKFYISVMQNWFTQLLKPYSMPDCKDTATKIAQAAAKETNRKEIDSDDEDDDEIELYPSGFPNKEDDDAEDIANSDRDRQDSSDDNVTNNEALQDGGVVETGA